MSEPYINIEQAAQHLGVSIGWIYRRCGTRRELPFYRVGNHLRFKISELEAFMEKHAVRPDTTLLLVETEEPPVSAALPKTRRSL